MTRHRIWPRPCAASSPTRATTWPSRLLVVAVRTDVPIPQIDAKLPSGPHDPEALVDLGERWNLDSSLNRVLNALASLRD